MSGETEAEYGKGKGCNVPQSGGYSEPASCCSRPRPSCNAPQSGGCSEPQSAPVGPGARGDSAQGLGHPKASSGIIEKAVAAESRGGSVFRATIRLLTAAATILEPTLTTIRGRAAGTHQSRTSSN